MYDYLDEVPWNSVPWVVGPSGNAIGIDPNGFAVLLTGPAKGRRVPLDAAGPWRPYTPPPEVLSAIEVLTERGVDGPMYEKLLKLS